MTPKLEGYERDRELKRISQPLRWPMFPMLPMEKHTDEGKVLGVIHYRLSPEVEDGGEVKVILRNMIELHMELNRMRNMEVKKIWEHLNAQPVLTYASTSELIDDGWVID